MKSEGKESEGEAGWTRGVWSTDAARITVNIWSIKLKLMVGSRLVLRCQRGPSRRRIDSFRPSRMRECKKLDVRGRETGREKVYLAETAFQ